MPLRLQILSPCDENWDEMAPEPGGERRYCDKCELHVHDLSLMHPVEAEELVEKPGRLCVRYLHDGGEVVHLTPDRRPHPWFAQAAAGLVLAGLAACAPHAEPDEMKLADEDHLASSPQPYTVPLAPGSGEGVEPCQPEPHELTPQKPGGQLRAVKGDRVAKRRDELREHELSATLGVMSEE